MPDPGPPTPERPSPTPGTPAPDPPTPPTEPEPALNGEPIEASTEDLIAQLRGAENGAGGEQPAPAAAAAAGSDDAAAARLVAMNLALDGAAVGADRNAARGRVRPDSTRSTN